MEEKKVEGILKVDNSKELKKGKLSFARKFISALTALSMSVFIALGTAACADAEQEPDVPPVNPNPPVVNPIDPDKPDPDKPDPDKPDPDKPDPDKPDLPPEGEPLTEQEKIQKIIAAVEPNVQYALTENSSNFNYLALDFKQEDNKNYADVLVKYIRKMSGKYVDRIGFVRIEMCEQFSEEGLKKETYKAINSFCGTTLMTPCPVIAQNERAEEALNKLKNDGVIGYLVNVACIYTGMTFNGSGNGTSDVLNCGVTNINIYRFDRQKILRCQLAVKSDGSTRDFIGDYLINGQVNKTYLKTDYEEFKFSPNAIYIASEFQNSDNLENVN